MSGASEAWLSGPVEGVTPYLMPVAHALVQVASDVEQAAADLTTDALWDRPGGAASVGFHLQHIGGALDRLLTYARGEALRDEQLLAARGERGPGEPPADAAALVRSVRAAVDRALEQVRATPHEALLEPREVGKQKLPSNVLGLLYHAAEHATRHAGQAISTARILRART
jgi:uncharacterized damage-inducible protein DinB